MKDIFSTVTGWLTVPEVANELGISVGKVNRLLEEHSLVSVVRDGKTMIPSELIVGREPLASLRGTVILLLDLGLSETEAVEWLYTHSEVLDSTPVNALLSGKKSPVRRLAQLIDI